MTVSIGDHYRYRTLLYSADKLPDLFLCSVAFYCKTGKIRGILDELNLLVFGRAGFAVIYRNYTQGPAGSSESPVLPSVRIL